MFLRAVGVSFRGFRSKLGPCLTEVHGVYTIDIFFATTFLAQPVLLSRLVLLFQYAFLESLGMLVWAGPKAKKAEFVKDAMSAKKPAEKLYQQKVPIMSAHYLLVQLLFFTAVLSSLFASGILGVYGLAVAFVGAMACVVLLPRLAGKTSLVEKVRFLKVIASEGGMVVLLIVGTPLLFASMTISRVYLGLLPLGLPVVLTVRLAYRAGERVLAHVSEDDATDRARWVDSQGNTLKPCGKELPAASTAKMAVGWLGSIYPYSSADGVLHWAKNDYLTFSETSFATVSGGLACLWGTLALSSTLVYAGWAVLDELVATTELPIPEWEEGARLIIAWAVTGCFVVVVGWVFVRINCGGGMTNLLLAAAVSLSYTIYAWTLPPATSRRLTIAYGNSFASLASLRFDWSTLLPPLDVLLEAVADPMALLQQMVVLVSDIARFVEIDPSEFARGMSSLNVLNVLLAGLKLLATYGQKAFALVDGVKALLGSAAHTDSDDSDDGTAQTRECVTDPDLAALAMLADKEAGHHSNGDDRKVTDLLIRETIDMSGSDGASFLDAEYAPVLVLLLQKCTTLTACNLLGNHFDAATVKMLANIAKEKKISLCGITPDQKAANFREQYLKPTDAILIAASLEFRKSLTSVNLAGNSLRVEGGKAIAEAISVNSSLTSIDLGENGLGVKGAKAIAEAISVSKSLTSVNLGDNSLGLDGGKAIAEAISVSKSLTECNVRGNKLDNTSAMMLAKVGTEKRVMLSGMKHDQAKADLSSQRLGLADAILIASDMAVSKSLKECDLCGNNLGQVGWCAIFDTLRDNPQNMIAKWELTSQGVDSEIAKSLAAYMAVSKSLTECNLQSNSLGAEGWTAIFTALRDSKVSKIAYWDLHQESGIKESIKPLAEYMSVSKSLTSIK